jgi:hypothetical protein
MADEERFRETEGAFFYGAPEAIRVIPGRALLTESEYGIVSIL